VSDLLAYIQGFSRSAGSQNRPPGNNGRPNNNNNNNVSRHCTQMKEWQTVAMLFMSFKWIRHTAHRQN